MDSPNKLTFKWKCFVFIMIKATNVKICSQKPAVNSENHRMLMIPQICSEKCIRFCGKAVCCWSFLSYLFSSFGAFRLIWPHLMFSSFPNDRLISADAVWLVFHLSTLGLTLFLHHNYFLPPLSLSLKSPCLISRPAIVLFFVFSAFNAPSGLLLFWADRDFLRLESISAFRNRSNLWVC